MRKDNSRPIAIGLLVLYIIRSTFAGEILVDFKTEFFIIVGILIFVYVYRFKGNKIERKYLIVQVVIVALLMISVMVLCIIPDDHSQRSQQYKIVILIIIIILNISFTVVTIADGIYKHKNNK
ncbi:hypothetical protein D4Z93_11960 [Clostridium fermenticellae]|uniref:Uncharacterized protein n=1 Tax=Clostridium fermenticellae TaxID=2068654 RepID=A0A386H6C5_9CLOT|nr:hypothetical protein [Clostridium fermenticellae]AYD41190.1 hypothetical protein D4Z93_11960 [Clostridium fermenticellae]